MVKSGLANAAMSLLAVLIPALAAMAVELIRRKLGIEKMRAIQHELDTKQELAVMAVRFVEQVYRDQHGEDKFKLAAELLASKAREHGLKLTSDEIQVLIESGLRALKDAYAEEWHRAINSNGVKVIE